jgi:hypothetical protein
VVIRVRKGSVNANFTVRRVAYGVGVERTFFLYSPSLEKVEVMRHAKVRRAKLYYLRGLTAKKARLKERRPKEASKTVPEVVPDEAPEAVLEEAPEVAPEEAPEAVLEEAPEVALEEVPDEASEAVLEEVPEAALEEAPEAVLEEEPEAVLEEESKEG